MKKEMLINVLQPEECRIAIVEDGVLEELYVERTSHESYTGNIYKGKIVNLEPAIQAAFVDFSVGRNGFLHVSDIEPQYFDRNPHARTSRARHPDRPPIASVSRAAIASAGRGRDDRRRPPPQSPHDPQAGPPPSAARPRRVPKIGPATGDGLARATATRNEAASENVPTCRSGAVAIVPSRRRDDSAKDWSSSRRAMARAALRDRASSPQQPRSPFEDKPHERPRESRRRSAFAVAGAPRAHLG